MPNDCEVNHINIKIRCEIKHKLPNELLKNGWDGGTVCYCLINFTYPISLVAEDMVKM